MEIQLFSDNGKDKLELGAQSSSFCFFETM